MDYGLAIIAGAIVGSFTFLIKDLVREGIEGLWLRFSDEINVNDKVAIMQKGKTLYRGIVRGIGLRNTVIENEEENLILIENSKIFNREVEKLDEEEEEKIY